MTEFVRLFSILISFAIPVFGACWVWQDARRLKKNGASVTPGLWAALVLFLWLVGLLAYLYLRQNKWQISMSQPPAIAMPAQDAGQPRISRPDKTELKVVYWMVSVILAIMLSMYATWVTVNRYPVPEGEAVSLGLLLFFLIWLLAVLVIGHLLVFGLRDGVRAEMGSLVRIFGAGFLAAAAVGSLTWGIGWFIADKPWVARAFGIAVPVLAILAILNIWWLRRKATAARRG